MNLFKDPIYLKSLLGEIDECTARLKEWSVNNDDIVTDELAIHAAQFDIIKIKIENYKTDVEKEIETGKCETCGTDLVEIKSSQDIDGNRSEFVFICPKCATYTEHDI